MRATDFELFDNGVRQRLDSVSIEIVPVDVILALDLSESVSGERLDSLVRAYRAALDALRPTDRAAVLTFSHEILERVPLSHERDRVLTALKGFSAGGSTSLYDAAYVGLRLGDATQARPLLLVFSDGTDSSSWLSAAEVLESALRSEVVAYAVVAQSSVGERPVDALMREPQRSRLRRPEAGSRAELHEFLQQLTRSTGGRLLRAKERELPTNFVEILREFQNRYLLTYTPRDSEKPGWHDIALRVKRRGAMVLARRGYWR